SIRARVKGQRWRFLSVVGRRYATSRAATRSRRTAESRFRKVGLARLHLLSDVGRRLNGLAEFDRIRDIRDRIHRRAGTGHDHRAVAEQASTDGLFDANALDLGKIELDGAALDVSEFRDDAAIGDGEVGGSA